MNHTLSEPELDVVVNCADRLRIIHSDCASLPPDRRMECLQDEVFRTFKDYNPSTRERLLGALKDRFPFQSADLPEAEAKPAAVALTPSQLAEQLVAISPELTVEQKAEIGRKLAEAGLGWIDREALELEISDTIRQRLGIPAGQNPKLSKMVEVTSLLLQTLQDLDRTGMLTLKELCPRSPVLNRPKDLRSAVGQYLTGATTEIDPQVRMVAALLGGLQAAMLGGGRDFGRQFTERFSPSAIEDVVAGEGRAAFMGPNKKERCWDKYNTLSKDIATPELIDRWVKDCLGRFVDSRAKIS